MIELLESKRPQIAALCRRYRVRRLEVFGSASASRFDPQASDVDFVVEFHPLGRGEHAGCYLGLLEALQQLLERPVDLVMARAITNRYLRLGIERNREVVYAA